MVELGDGDAEEHDPDDADEGQLQPHVDLEAPPRDRGVELFERPDRLGRVLKQGALGDLQRDRLGPNAGARQDLGDFGLDRREVSE